MKFPLGVVADYLEDAGYEITCVPSNLRATFDWVSADVQAAASSGRQMLVVASVYREVPADMPVVLTSAGEATTARPNAFLLTHVDEPPSVVAQKIQLYLLSLYEWVERMHQALGDHCSCEEMLRLSEPVLKNYVSVTDSTFAHIAHTPGIEPIEETSRYLIEQGRYSDETLAAVNASGLSEMWTKALPFYVFESNAINPMPSIEHVYHLNNQYAAHLVMVCPHSITPGQEFLFSLLIGPIGTILKGQWQVDNPLKQRYTSFLSNLIHEDQSNKLVTRELARVVGIPTEGLFKVCVVDDSWKGGSSSYFAVRAAALVPGCKVIVEDDKLVVLLHADAEAGKSKLSYLENRLFDLVASLGAQVGVSCKFFDLLGMASAYDEARIALKYGKICFKDFVAPGEADAGSPNTYIYRFKRYFPFFVGDPSADKNVFFRRHNVATRVLGRIEWDDMENGTSDIKVLRAYLHAGCSIAGGSSELGMHRNSFAYRLEHIEKTYDLNLSDPDERAFLLTLFMLPRQ